MKTLQERLDEILVIRKKIRDLGLGTENIPALAKVFSRMNDFVKEGVTWSGSVFLDEADRWIDVLLSNRKPCEVMLRVPSTSKKVSRRP
jgi:hypothetical protein